jgi:hypothetical protein
MPKWLLITGGLVVGTAIGVGIGWYVWKASHDSTAAPSDVNSSPSGGVTALRF